MRKVELKIPENGATIEYDNKEFLEKDNIIKWATPIALNIIEKETNNSSMKIASLTFFCMNENNTFLTINRNFIIDMEEEEEFLSFLDLHMDNIVTNLKICIKQIINNCPCYVSEFNFKIKEDNKKIVCFDAANSKTGEIRNFKINLDVFMSLSYIEDMIYNCEVENDLFFTIATVIGSKAESGTELFIVDTIQSIIAVTSGIRASTEKLHAIKEIFINEPTEKLAVVLDVIAKDTSIREDVYTLMIPFTSKTAYRKNKFKQMTIERMEEIYFGAPNQYSNTLMVNNVKILNGEKSYTAFRTKNSLGKTKIFLIDSDTMDKIQEKIDNF